MLISTLAAAAPGHEMAPFAGRPSFGTPYRLRFDGTGVPTGRGCAFGSSRLQAVAVNAIPGVSSWSPPV